MEVYTDAMGTTHCRVNMDELMKITPPGYQPKVPKDSEIPWPKMGSFTWEMGPDSSWDLGWAHRLSQQFPSWAKLSAHCQQGPHGRDVCPPTPQRPKRAFENLMETYPWKYYGKNSHNLCPGCPLPDFHIDPDLWQGEVAALRKIWEQEEKLAKAEGAVQEEAAVLANANVTPVGGLDEMRPFGSVSSLPSTGARTEMRSVTKVTPVGGIPEMRGLGNWEDHGMPSSNELPLPGAVVEEISAETTNCRAALSPHIDEENSKGTTSCQAAPSPEIVEEILVGTAGCHAACPSKGRVRTAAALKADADGCIECPGLGDSRLQSHKGVSENPIPLMAPPQFVDAGVGCTPPTFQDRQVQKESADFAVTCTLASADSVQLAQRCVQGTHDLVKSGLGGNTLQSPKGTGESCIPQQVLPQFVDVGVGRTPPTFQDVQVQKESAACATKENSIPRSEDSMQLAQGCVCETHDLVTPAVSAAEVERMQEPLLGEIDVSRTLMCTEEVRPLKVLAMIQERRNMPTYVPPGVRPRRESWPSQETPLYVHNRQKIQSVDTEAPAMVGSEHLCVASAESEPHSDDLGIQGGVSAPASSPGGASLPFCSPSGAPPLACSSGSDASYHSPQPVGHGAVAISDADVGTAMDVAFGLNDVDSDRANWERVVDGSARMSCQRCHTPTETVDVGVGPSPPPTVEQRMSKRSRTTKEHQFINLKKRISERKSLIGGNFGTSLNSEGRRRSKRVTRPPLEYWRNEMKEYGRDHSSLPTVQGYVLRSPDMLWPCSGVPMKGKQKRRRNDAKL